MRLQNRREYTVKGENTIERFVEEGSWKRKGNVEEISQEEEEEERHLSLPGSGRNDKPGTRFRTQLLAQSRTYYHENKYEKFISERKVYQTETITQGEGSGSKFQ